MLSTFSEAEKPGSLQQEPSGDERGQVSCSEKFQAERVEFEALIDNLRGILGKNEPTDDRCVPRGKRVVRAGSARGDNRHQHALRSLKSGGESKLKQGSRNAALALAAAKTEKVETRVKMASNSRERQVQKKIK